MVCRAESTALRAKLAFNRAEQDTPCPTLVWCAGTDPTYVNLDGSNYAYYAAGYRCAYRPCIFYPLDAVSRTGY